MMQMSRVMTKCAVLSCTLVLLLATLGCMGGEEDSVASTPAPTFAQATTPKALFEDKCSGCHSLRRPASNRRTYDEWLSTVHRMIRNGAPVTKEEAVIIAEYLAENYGK